MSKVYAPCSKCHSNHIRLTGYCFECSDCGYQQGFSMEYKPEELHLHWDFIYSVRHPARWEEWKIECLLLGVEDESS